MTNHSRKQTFGVSRLVKVIIVAACALASSYLSAQEFSEDSYEVYFGDFNGDGKSGDVYIHHKDVFVLIFGSISIPIYTASPESYVYYEGGSSSGNILKLRSSELKNYQKAEKGVHYAFSNEGGSSDSDLVVLNPGNWNSTLTFYGGGTGAPLAITGSGTTASDTIARLGLGGLNQYPGFDYSLADTYFLPQESIGEFVAITQGEVSVEQGMANYNVDIDLPPAINDLKPSLSFSYNSANMRSGTMGVGWGVGGLSKITRCTKNKIQVPSVTYTNQDHLCLDGKKLQDISVGTIIHTGTSGDIEITDEMRPHFAGNQNLRTEIDQLARIKTNSDTTQITVELKSGEILTYGEEAYSGRNSLVHLGHNSTNPIKEWLLRKVEDRYGNYYEFFYKWDTTGDQNVQYIRFSNQSLVKFEYEDKTQDILWGYEQGFKYQQTKILKRVKTYIDIDGWEEDWVDGGTLVKQYDLDYEFGGLTDRYRLKSIAECGFGVNGKQCARPLNFEWQDGSNSFGDETQLVMCDGSNIIAKQMFDFDKDGYNDILAEDKIALYNQSSSCFDSPDWLHFPNADTYFPNAQVLRERSGNAIVSEDKSGTTLRKIAFNFSAYTQQVTVLDSVSNRSSALVYDTNHDGLDNVLFVRNFLYMDDDYENSELTEPFFLDLDGDNEDEIFFTMIDTQTRRSHVHYFRDAQKEIDSTGNIIDNSVRTGNVSTFDPSPFGAAYTLEGGNYRIFVDLNGDSLKDLAYHRNSTWYVRMTRQNGELGPEIDTGITTVRAGVFNSYAYDVNRDGIEDIVQCDGRAIIAHHSGNTDLAVTDYEPQLFFTISQSEISDDSNCGPVSNWQNASRIRGDYNNDGLPDLFDGMNVRPALPEYPDVLVGVTDGFGRKIELVYSPMNQENYTPTSENSISYPLEQAPRIQVVEKLRADNGLGAFNETSYKYGAVQFDWEKRGFLAFSRVEAKDLAKDTLTRNLYKTEFPYIGLISGSYVYGNDNKLIKATTYTYKSRNSVLNGTIVWPMYEVQKVYSLEEGSRGTEIRAFGRYKDDVDIYGNIKTTIESQGEKFGAYYQGGIGLVNYSKILTTTKYYDNDVSTWLLRIPKETVKRAIDYTGSAPSSIETTSKFQPEPGTMDVKVETQFADTISEIVSTTNRNDNGVVTSVETVAMDYDGTQLPTRTTTFEDFEDYIYPTTIKNAKNQTSIIVYDKRFGSVAKTTDPNNLVSTTIFDSLGRALVATDALNNKKSSKSFYCDGAPTSVNCPTNAFYGSATFVTNDSKPGAYAAPVSVIYYDKLQREVRSEVYNFNGDVITVDKFYNSTGQLAKVSEPYASGATVRWIEYKEYDVLDRPLRIEKPDGGDIEYTYDEKSGENVIHTETVSVSTPNGVTNRSKYTYLNSAGQIVKVEDAEDIVVEYAYSPHGNLANTIVDDNPDTTITIAYDVAGNKTRIEDPDAGVVSYQYNGFGELRVQTWAPDTADSKSITYNYDVLGRKTGRVDSGGSQPASYSWVWDTRKIGMVSSVTGNGLSDEFYYNTNAQLTTQTSTISGIETKTFSYTYDDFGRVETQTYPSGLKLRQEYHSAGALVRTRDDNSGKLLWVQGEQSDDRGALTHGLFGNETLTVRNYDAENGLIQSIVTGNINSSGSAVGNIQSLHYEFDSIGNLYSRESLRTSLGGSALEQLKETYTYDNINRLKTREFSNFGVIDQAKTKSYGYDDLGNMTTRTGVSNIAYSQTNGAGVHGITAANDTSYYYDAYGNLLQRVSTTKGTQTMEYNAFNKPTRIGNATFLYGAEHQRFKQVNGSRVTYYYGGGLYEVIVENGITTEKSYVGDYLVQSKTNSTVTHTYLHRDHLGSVDAMTNAAGEYLGRMSFDAWGERREPGWGEGAVDVSSFVTSRGYTGHEMLDDTGLVHMNGRVYDPVIGRFLSPDLFVQSPYNSQSFNRYSYVFNNPLSVVDPSGYLGADDIMHSMLSNMFIDSARSMRYTTFFKSFNKEKLQPETGVTAEDPKIDENDSGDGEEVENTSDASENKSSNETATNVALNGNVSGGAVAHKGQVTSEDITGTKTTIRIRRFAETDEGTIGELTVDGTNFKAYTLEPAGASSVVEGSDKRILAGTYEVERYNSTKYKSVYEVQNVPGRTKILFHVGNFPEDTLGCFLVGQTHSTNAVYSSAKAFSQFRDTLSSYHHLNVTITNDF